MAKVTVERIIDIAHAIKANESRIAAIQFENDGLRAELESICGGKPTTKRKAAGEAPAAGEPSARPPGKRLPSKADRTICVESQCEAKRMKGHPRCEDHQRAIWRAANKKANRKPPAPNGEHGQALAWAQSHPEDPRANESWSSTRSVVAFDADAYLAKFDVDGYLARFAAPAVRRRAPSRCRRCGQPGHRAPTCDALELDRLMLIEQRAHDLDQARRLGLVPKAAHAEVPPTLQDPRTVRETAAPSSAQAAEPLTADDLAFWDAEIARLPPEPPEPIDTKESVLVQPPAVAEPLGPETPAVPVVLGLSSSQRRLTVTTDGRVRSRTIGPHKLYMVEKREADSYPQDVERPATRADCEGGERPCPFVSCRHHMYLDEGLDGALKVNFPHLEPSDIPETCSLDVADRDGVTLEEVGRLMNVSRERVRQIEAQAMTKCGELGRVFGDGVGSESEAA